MVDGEVRFLSFSALEKFNPAATFGCPRKWWFRYVAGIPDPPSKAAELGSAIHQQIEHYLRTGEDVLGPEARAGKWFFDALRPDLMLLRLTAELEPEPALEVALESLPGPRLTFDGVPFVGRIDALAAPPQRRRQVIDWKTSKDPEKYGKTPEQLRQDIQMLGYAHAVRESPTGLGHGARGLEVLHGQIATKLSRGKGVFRVVRVDVEDSDIDAGVNRIVDLVRGVKSAAREKEVRNLDANPEACDVGQGCPYKLMCPLKGRMKMPGFLASLKKSPPNANPPPASQTPPSQAVVDAVPVKTEPAVPVVAPVPVTVFAKPASPAVQPPDVVTIARGSAGTLGQAPAAPPPAPMSENPLAAALPPEKRPRGRPRKTELVAGVNAPTEAPVESAVVAPTLNRGVEKFEIYSATIRQGVTLHLGNHQFVKAEVELTARFDGISVEDALARLSARVESALEADVEKKQGLIAAAQAAK